MAIYASVTSSPGSIPRPTSTPTPPSSATSRSAPERTVWPQAVLRGDYGVITVGARTSVQDGAVLHTPRSLPRSWATTCVIGHLAHLECCTVHDGALDRHRFDRAAPRR